MVDAYNWGSVLTHIPMGAYDLEKIQGPFQIKFSREGERYIPVSKKKEKILNKKEIVNADINGKIMCQYPYQDAYFSRITNESTKILLVAYGAPGIEKKNLLQALQSTKNHLEWLAQQGFIEFSGKDFQYYTNSIRNS
jgi:DNA/RNA-binding domain of Phe-tRNA-synthetase-like protein